MNNRVLSMLKNIKGLDFLRAFGLNASRAPLSEHNPLEVDTHAHWLPGVDDGAKTMEEGLTIVKRLRELGFKKLIATPHIDNNFYKNDPKNLRFVFKEFKALVDGAGIKVKLHLAAEYMLDDGFLKQLEKDQLLCLQGNLVLVEMSTLQKFPLLFETLFKLQVKGYHPVLAHPERYIYFQGNMQAFQKLKDIGCLFQLDLLSLAGYYGKSTADTAKKLIENCWYELSGTDAHNLFHLKKISEVLLPKNLPTNNFLKLKKHTKMSI